MMSWPLGGPADDLQDRCVRFHKVFLRPLMDLGVVWETADGLGALVLVPPEEARTWDEALAQIEDLRTNQVTDDGGRRYERFWDWVASKLPDEPLWHLDSVAVTPGSQGRRIGSALIEFALDKARQTDTAMILETATERNVHLYERLGFRVVEEADSPDGGPHVWFMRREP
jgi:ribosomal protein S18 acetylase RimI-like enzyme